MLTHRSIKMYQTGDDVLRASNVVGIPAMIMVCSTAGVSQRQITSTPFKKQDWAC